MKTKKLTDFDAEMLRRVSWGNIRAQNCNGVTKQALNRLVKKGLATKFTGAFGEDEWTNAANFTFDALKTAALAEAKEQP